MVRSGAFLRVKKQEHDDSDKARLEKLSKARLVKVILKQRKTFHCQLEEKEQRIVKLTEQLLRLTLEREEKKHAEINKHVNEPCPFGKRA